jgi:hypothetical protein
MTGSRRAQAALAVLLVVGEPLGLAFYASSTYLRLLDRGMAAVLWLAARLLIVGVGIAAGLALWHGRPGALVLARTAVVLAAGAVLVTFLSPAFPANRPPGTTLPLLVVLIGYYGAWLAWLYRQRDD